jgi:hypothetical protein
MGAIIGAALLLASVASGCSIMLPAAVSMASAPSDNSRRLTGNAILAQPPGSRLEVRYHDGRKLSGRLIRFITPDSSDDARQSERSSTLELRSTWQGTVQIPISDIAWTQPATTSPMLAGAVVLGAFCDFMIIRTALSQTSTENP